MMQKIFRLNTRNSPATWKDFMVSLTSINDHITFPVMSFGQLSMTSFWILRVFTNPYFIQGCDVTINWADIVTEWKRQVTTAHANQTTGLTNGRAANWAPEVEFSPLHTLSCHQMKFLFCC